jgi:hypothetical protein
MTTVARRPSNRRSRNHRRQSPGGGNAADGSDPAAHAELRLSEPMSMAEAIKVRAACYAHARDLLDAATKSS